MTPTVDKLNSRHYKMLYAYVTEGLSNRDMANRFDMNEGYMPTIKNSPAWKKEEDALREEIYGSHKAKLGNLIPDAIDLPHNAPKILKRRRKTLKKDPDTFVNTPGWIEN